MANNSKKQRLLVEVVNGRLVISVGIDTLAWAVEHSFEPSLCEVDYERDQIMTHKVLDPKGFAGDVRQALEAEEEDGTTPIHLLLDNACTEAIEDGSLHVAEKMEDMNEKQDGR